MTDWPPEPSEEDRRAEAWDDFIAWAVILGICAGTGLFFVLQAGGA
jgi:proteasome lid subunit RPN8/RPN11